MYRRKLAILLDFDGPLFNNDAVKIAIMRDFGLSEAQWSEIYNNAKEGTSYVDYGKIMRDISSDLQLSEKEIWRYLLSETKGSQYCSEGTKQALLRLSALGSIELITQGNNIYQNIKVKASGVRSILKESESNSIVVIAEDKTQYLTERLEKLVGEGYDVVQIDDRVGPLLGVNRFAAEHALSDHLYQIRIRTGKYNRENDPVDILPENVYPWTEFSTLSEASRYLNKQLRPIPSVEGVTQSGMLK